MKARPLNSRTLSQPGCPPFLSIPLSTSHNMLEDVLGPRVDEKILEEMEANFPVHNPHPKEELSVIMYKAGQRSVVEWYKARLDE